eukprot:11140746-Ditylum_brightwellii.AAC.1
MEHLANFLKIIHCQLWVTGTRLYLRKERKPVPILLFLCPEELDRFPKKKRCVNSQHSKCCWCKVESMVCHPSCLCKMSGRETPQ